MSNTQMLSDTINHIIESGPNDIRFIELIQRVVNNPEKYGLQRSVGEVKEGESVLDRVADKIMSETAYLHCLTHNKYFTTLQCEKNQRNGLYHCPISKCILLDTRHIVREPSQPTDAALEKEAEEKFPYPMSHTGPGYSQWHEEKCKDIDKQRKEYIAGRKHSSTQGEQAGMPENWRYSHKTHLVKFIEQLQSRIASLEAAEQKCTCGFKNIDPNCRLHGEPADLLQTDIDALRFVNQNLKSNLNFYKEKYNEVLKESEQKWISVEEIRKEAFKIIPYQMPDVWEPLRNAWISGAEFVAALPSPPISKDSKTDV